MSSLATTYSLALPLKSITLVSAAFSIVLIGIVFQLPFVVMAIPILVILIVQVGNRTLGTAFLILASIHATYSYLSAALGGIIGVHPDSNTELFLLEAYKVYFFGIVSMLVGYGVSRSRRLKWRHLEVLPIRLDGLMTWLTLAAVLLIGMVFYQIGFVQMLLSGTFDRYFGEAQVGSSFMLYQSLLRRALAILSITIPILLLRWQERRSKYLLMLACVGLLGMIATAHRGYVAVTVMSFVVTNAVYGKNRKAIVAIVVVLVFAFFSAQALLVDIDSASGGVVNNALFVLRSGSTEVNDLAWVLSEWNHHWYMGATWMAALLPVPATMSAFKDANVLSSVTKDVAGIPRESGGGGLRISMFGEAYLNLGFLGVVGLGFLFGILVRQTNGLIAWAKPQGPLILLPFIFFYFVFLFQSYLSGTGTFSDALLSCLALVSVYVYAARKAQATVLEQAT